MKNFDLTFVVDDDPIFVLIFEKILKNIKNFNKIQNIKNGHEALTILQAIDKNNEKFPDLIFLDLNMPIVDGWQLLENLESESFKNKLSIYVISSTIDEKEIQKTKNYSTVKKFIQKPTTIKGLLSSLELVD